MVHCVEIRVCEFCFLFVDRAVVGMQSNSRTADRQSCVKKRGKFYVAKKKRKIDIIHHITPLFAQLDLLRVNSVRDFRRWHRQQ